MSPLCLPCFHFLAPFAFFPSVVAVGLHCIFLVCLPALRVPFLSTLAIAFHSCSFFADPLSPVHSRSSLLYLPSGCSVFLCAVFLLGPVVGPRFYVPVDSFVLPFLGLVFLFRCFVRLPSLSAGG